MFSSLHDNCREQSGGARAVRATRRSLRYGAVSMSALLATAAFAAAPAGAAPVAGQAPFTSQSGKVSPPPTRAGCYQSTPNGWRMTPCATRSYIAAHIPHPELLAGVGGRTIGSSTAAPFDLSVVGATPMVGGSDTDNTYGSDYYSVQNNVLFTGSNGHQDGVQFTDQSGGGIDNICVWQVDVKTQKYTPVCIPLPSSGLGRVVLVEGFALDGLLGGVAETSQGSVLASVLVPDTYGLENKGRWNNASGSVLGFGNGSRAVFSATEERIGVTATSCLDDAGILSFTVPCSLKPVKPLAYTGYSPGPLSYGIGTVESNNLWPVIGSLPTHLPALSYPNTFTAHISYVASTSGKCFSGAPPNC